MDELEPQERHFALLGLGLLGLVVLGVGAVLLIAFALWFGIWH